MKSSKAIVLLCLIVSIFEFSFQADPFCSPVTQNIDPTRLPKLPNEFQTRMEINYISELRSEEVFVKFDFFSKKAEMSKRANGKNSRTIFFYDKNEVFYVEKNMCSASKLNESSSNLFFGLTYDGNSFNMQESNYFFHFNNGYPTMKLDDEMWRDIPASHYKSCQNWPQVNGNVMIDYYFSNPNHKYPLTYYPEINEIPITIKIEGYINMNQPEPTKVKIEYNFYEFRTAIERKFDLFTLPAGMYCNGQTYKEDLPTIPDSFSFSEEIIAQQFDFETNSRVFYSKKLKAVRYDFEGSKIISPWFVEGSYKTIHDFNSGVGYAVNKENQDCLMYPMGTLSIDRNDIFPNEKRSDALIRLREPNEFFYLDDSYFYAGQRYERDILCDVYISKRNDIKIGNITGLPVIVEFFFQNTIANFDQGSDGIEQVIPLSVHVTIEANGLKIINHIYNFDSTIYEERFDLSECFRGREKVLFAMRFRLPEQISIMEFERTIGRRVIEPFENAMKQTFGSLEYSPLRIVPPKIVYVRNSFEIHSGLTATAPAIYHFQKKENTKIDTSKAKYTFRVDSPDKCSSICLNKNDMKALTRNPEFECKSFDFCSDATPSDFVCVFYNRTISDDDVVVESAPVCEHYSKSTKEYDSATLDQLYGSLKEAILRKQFKFEYQTQTKASLTFIPEDIFEPNQQQSGNSSGFGFTSFFERFDNFYPGSDFNETTIESDRKLFLRKKMPTSIDECARLCITEPTFDCQTMSFNDQTQECKWSSILLITPDTSIIVTSIVPKEGSSIFIRDPLYNFNEFPFKVTALVDYSVKDVSSATECAFNCEKETKIKCRSFNLCKQDDGKYRCLLSETNIHNTEKDPNIVYSAICSHYSKRAINDYEQVTQTQLGVKPQTKLVEQSVEGCAEICSLDDSFFCRSFDYDIATRTCYLFEENLKDKKLVNLGIKSNPNFTHYSRLYYEENGVLKSIQPRGPKSDKKYGGGTIFGVVIAIIIAGIIIGAALGFAYLKYSNTSNLLPVMKFTNPNYENQS